MKRRQTGTRGELLAAGYLRSQGFTILETNYRCSEGEIDIVARDGETMVFVEVKARRNRNFGSPEESVTPAKQQRLRLAVARYCEEHPGTPEQRRIDVVAVEMDAAGEPTRIELIRNAVGEASS